jgi:GDP-L-fucose synthase
MAQLSAADRIFVAGHRGLVGSAILRALHHRGYPNLVTRTRTELDLLDQRAVAEFFAREQPTAVIVAAAKVGGILANHTDRADFLYQNLQIQNNVLWAAHVAGVHRLVFLGSSCIYPRAAPQPMPESALLTGALEPTNQPYAIAKIAGLELVSAIRAQHGRDWFSAMPTNLYGPGDNFHPTQSHVLPGLNRRFHEAAEAGAAEVVVWGTGRPLRELMHADDCADAVVFLAETLTEEHFARLAPLSHVNVGSGDEVSIGDLARLVADATGYRGQLRFDPSKPDGTPRKLLDLSVLRSLGWQRKIPLARGLAETVAWFRESYSSLPP